MTAELHAAACKGRLLVVLHQESSSTGRVGQLLARSGYRFDIRRPVLGDALPDHLEDHAGVVVFGGPMSANDCDEGILRETRWMEVVLNSGKPYLGICLGAQILVNHLGGRIATREDGQVEIGWYKLQPTALGRSMMQWPDMVYQFHREGFDLPRGADLLATGEAYPNQAFRYGDNAWGIQFHAELTLAMMNRWAVHGAHRFVLPNAQPGRAHLDGRLLHDARLLVWLEQFLPLVFEPEAQSGFSAAAVSRSLSSD